MIVIIDLFLTHSELFTYTGTALLGSILFQFMQNRTTSSLNFLCWISTAIFSVAALSYGELFPVLMLFILVIMERIIPHLKRSDSHKYIFWSLMMFVGFIINPQASTVILIITGIMMPIFLAHNNKILRQKKERINYRY